MVWEVRRVVTGRNEAGRSVVVSDGRPAGTISRAGFGRAPLWALPSGPLHPEACLDLATQEGDLEPPPGAITWQVLRISPTGEVHHPPLEEIERDPRYRVDRPGVHRTDTLPCYRSITPGT